MRDASTIDQVLGAVREVWALNPDMRLCQLLVNAVCTSDPTSDLFSVEDTVLVRKLRTFGERLKK